MNYKGIKLMSHTMKFWERVIEHRLRQETRVSDNQFRLMPDAQPWRESLSYEDRWKKYRGMKKRFAHGLYRFGKSI